MAAGAYGAILSLMHLLENLQHPFRRSHQHLHYDRNQIHTLSENLTFLLGFFEDYSDIICQTDDVVELARQIGYAVDEAEEIIDYHVVDQLSQGSGYDVCTGLSSFHEDLERVLDKIESKKRALMMVQDREIAVKAPPPARVSIPAAGSSAPPSTSKTNTMVGFDDRSVHIMALLTGNESDLQIVSITGMGGIGKTTLAQNVFNNRCIVDRFDLSKWITISQSFRIQELLECLVGKSHDQENKESNQILAELGEKLHKMLFGRRYLIVMDDVWSTEVWRELRRFFPNNKNGSRILVTTRLSKVSVSFGSHKPYSMPFLNKEISWKLFCVKAFGKEVCPNSELEEIGKKIVECCKGLPLAISTIGGLLGKSNMTRDEWELVAKDVLKSIDNSKDDGDCSNILSLSYKHLPIHLKPCFLYMRICEEDEEIPVDDLINYWVAEGFVKPKDGQTLEEVAFEYLKDLIDRSLILVHYLDSYTGANSKCKVHDLLRDLCMREYEKELFFVISKVRNIYRRRENDTCSLCRYRKASTWIFVPQVVTTFVSGKVCYVCEVICDNRNKLRFIKLESGDFGPKYIAPTRLRYLVIPDGKDKFESTVLSLFWNLQFLDLSRNGMEQPAIWVMPQLRSLTVRVSPRFTQTGMKNCCGMEKLQFLKIYSEDIECWCVEEILKRIPNVKTLEIECKNHSKEVHNFAHLHKLERLVWIGVNPEYISFPKSLKWLELGYCECPWEGITIIGSLPNLEVLIIRNFSPAPEWNPIEGEFLRLKMLLIAGSVLVRWNAEKYHFPRLEILELSSMCYLEEIPSGIGDIDTLRQIGLWQCSESSVRSAKEIVAEQRDCGNEQLKLFIDDRMVSDSELEQMVSDCDEVFVEINDVYTLREIEEVWGSGNEERLPYIEYKIYEEGLPYTEYKIYL